MRTAVFENQFIKKLTSGFPKSPLQINKPQESDAELIEQPGSPLLLAITCDEIAEEIETGLYDEPEMIGRMAVVASISDLAAVGANPLGILLSESIPESPDPDFITRLQHAIRETCARNEVAVLGGDTNLAGPLRICVTAIGLVPAGRQLTRKGAQPGDVVMASGRLGAGNVFAMAQLGLLPPDYPLELPFEPVPQLKCGMALREFASATMDTSDGVIATLDQLARINEVGFELDAELSAIMHESAISVCRETGIPLWLPLCGPHGEFELLFTVKAHLAHAVERMLEDAGCSACRLGRVTNSPEITITDGADNWLLDTAAMRNLFWGSGWSPHTIINDLTHCARPCNHR